MGKRYYYNPDELIELNEQNLEALESLDTRRGRKFRQRNAALAKKKKYSIMVNNGWDKEDAAKNLHKNFPTPSAKKQAKKATYKAVRHTKPDKYEDICYNGGLYKRVYDLQWEVD